MKKLYFMIAGLIVVVVVVIYLIPTSKKTEQAENGLPPGHPDMSQMKGDDKGGPNKNNVRQDFLQELSDLKAKVDAQKASDTTDVWKLARLLADAHKTDQSIAYFERVVKAAPRNTDVLLDMSVALFNLGKKNDALDATRKIMKIDPKNTIAMYNYGAILAEMGKNEEAKKAWQKLIDKFPASADAGRAKEAMGKLGSNSSPH
jgi:tetratricopeptide (TPR) repeat protein